jgi:hypothetical protein
MISHYPYAPAFLWQEEELVYVFIFGYSTSLLSLCILATMANAQTPSNSTSGTNSTTNNETGVKQMGICQIGSKSPCNGNSGSPT